jgi:hypothetical protein
VPETDGVLIGSEHLKHAPMPKPTPASERRRGLIGEYGWDHDTLYILEKDNKLTALIEWYDYYPLEEVSPDVFRFPSSGLYDGETLAFHRGDDGRAAEAVLGSGVVFARRKIAGESQTSAHIEPLEPVDALRRRAMTAQPPKETGDFR